MRLTRLQELFVALAINITVTVTIVCLVIPAVHRKSTGLSVPSPNTRSLGQFYSTLATSSHGSRRSNKTHTILLFKPASWLLIKNYNDFLSNRCKFDNCRLTTSLANLGTASAIIYCLKDAPRLPEKPPIISFKRNHNQVWIYLWLEPPVNNRGANAIFHNKHWRNALNWTMTYTYDSDVFLPYGALRPRTPPDKNYQQIFESKTKMAAWIVSHCRTQSKREIYVEQLQQYGIKVDIFGGCAGKRVDGDWMRKEIDSRYKFYLSFENSFCKDYVTEKLFKYFSYDVVLVVRGGGNYSSILPNDSYINTADFGSVKNLAKYLRSVGSSQEKYINYLKNKDRFESISKDVRNESFCTVCEKLNNLQQNRQTYTDLLDRVYNGTVFPPRDIEWYDRDI